MDVQFIKKMCESYYNDFDLSKTNLWKSPTHCVSDLNSEITKIIQGLKTEDVELYESLFNFSRQTQYNIIYNLLEDYISTKFGEDSIITEEFFSLSAVITALTIAVAAYVGTEHATNVINTTMIGLAKLNEAIYKKIKSLTEKHRIYGAIIRTDQEQCLKTCGIENKKDLDKWTLSAALYDLSMNSKSRNQASCLIVCYLNTSCQYAEALASSYRQCLVATGHDPNDIDSLSAVLSIPTDYQCKTFHDLLISHGKEYDKVVDLCFAELSISKRNAYLKAYEQAINSGLKTGKVQKAYTSNYPPKNNNSFSKNNSNQYPRNDSNPQSRNNSNQYPRNDSNQQSRNNSNFQTKTV